ncbi:hypothetical protein BV22DRAFT_1135675 [Leucogyrophana mollusca]|uniref:Uncharacterized protein n=1 Tax=Leucogyrophana mollusca TaxID=85980 RepID=A0ACB8AVC4_9AGAM|nr:hypothetical protein BV22DRAFT_1135675 [Leucogyrophana mollusca]
MFLALCRHGFCLLVADMVQSGELSKYPLAIILKMLDAFSEGLGCGYDIGCQFKTTLNCSTLGARARALGHTCLVGAFHGHAHRRLCQLFFLAMYVKGLGLEDLEGCERTFSKSNALASSLHYSSVFHRRQAITTYFEHNDNYEVYHNLTTFLYNNYKQALDILETGPITLAKVMDELKLTDEKIFEQWLEEEKVYLTGLQKEPEVKTLQMEYWQRLVNLQASKNELDAATSIWQLETPASMSAGPRDSGRAKETARQHAIEIHANSLKVVQELERKLGVDRHWVPEDAEWQSAGRLVAMQKYQRVLDVLEGLIVARMFELTKINRSQTGYSLRKHIGKALQTRSAAICKVVKYAFLADFDLLWDARQDISQRDWATPKGRLAMDHYFKICRAREEIQRLNVEARCVATYIRDEDQYLRACEEQARTSHPALAHQVSLYRKVRGRFNSHHLRRLKDIATLPGFSGSIIPGVSSQTGTGESASTPGIHLPAVDNPIPIQTLPRSSVVIPESQEDLKEEDEEEEHAEEHLRALHDITQAFEDS